MSKPLKRHPFIVEFSRDHHYGLLLAWKIRQGLKKRIESQRITVYLNLFAERELFPHFAEEEKYLLSLLPENDILRKQIEAEHDRLRRLVAGCNHVEDITKRLKEFADHLETHIRFEERMFFPHLERTVDMDSINLTEMKSILHDRNSIDAEWTDNFWEIIK
jgi:hemerythrin-like domain-containing protein